ncbi:cell division topological specificity factor MinE [Candidatus Electronema sp. TJ]|uniref:cell division topological specificity factor MinE n=1 Tax=Candidatus Electronema sp. TJ TaxID=3401573 RepID=UPI003AA9837D
MGLFDYFNANRRSAEVAKERLSILIARDKIQRNRPSFLPQLQDEILAVIKKYVDINQDDVSITLDRENDCEILEVNIALPEKSCQQRTDTPPAAEPPREP